MINSGQRPQGHRISWLDRPDLGLRGASISRTAQENLFGLLLAFARSAPSVTTESASKGGGEQRLKRCHRVQFTAEPQFDQQRSIQGVVSKGWRSSGIFSVGIQPDAIHDYQMQLIISPNCCAPTTASFQRRPTRKEFTTSAPFPSWPDAKEFQRGGCETPSVPCPDQQMSKS